jgi:diketogulonate reductase-like aldo/keto reductase
MWAGEKITTVDKQRGFEGPVAVRIYKPSVRPFTRLLAFAIAFWLIGLIDAPDGFSVTRRRTVANSVPDSTMMLYCFLQSLDDQNDSPLGKDEPTGYHYHVMEQKPLGKTDVRIPEIGLGTWVYAGGVEPLRKGIELGACFIDTAESYGTEEVVGEAIKGIREQVFIGTKVSPVHLRRNDLMKAADQSLRHLKTDYIDLYQIHGPNPTIPIEETMAAMEELVDGGKVRFIGVSNFTLWELKRAQAVMQRHTIVSNQVRYSLIERTIERGLLDYCQENCVTVLAFSPLGGGIQNIHRKDKGGVLRKVAAATGKTEAQIALNWCVTKKRVIAITKSNSVDRVVEDCQASSWRLSSDDMRMLDEGIKYRSRGPVEVALRHLAKRILLLELKVLKRP